MTKKQIKISLIDSDASSMKEASVYIDIDKNHVCSIEIIIEEDLKKIFTASDFFTALSKLRKWLHDWKGYYPLINGSLINVYPSRMSRQMSKGVKAYFLTTGKQAEKKDLVDIFHKVQEMDTNKLATVEEQEDYYANWLKSL